MFLHDLYFGLVVIGTLIWAYIASTASDWIQIVPGAALGGVGFVALVWKLVKDNTADQVIREGFDSLVKRERERADRAEEAIAELIAQQKDDVKDYTETIIELHKKADTEIESLKSKIQLLQSQTSMQEALLADLRAQLDTARTPRDDATRKEA